MLPISPDFFIVGAPKAGTWSIYKYLKQHPGIFAPRMKEPCYFSQPEMLSNYYGCKVIDNLEAYSELYQDSEGRLKGDFTPSYLSSLKAAERIKKVCPDSKIVMILRDPVKRAISHYLMDVRLGVQPRPLNECLFETEQNKKFYRAYITVGLYFKQVARYFEFFDRDRIKIILFDDFSGGPEAVVNQILSFLELKESSCVSMDRIHNAHSEYRNSIVKYVLSSNWAIRARRNVPVGLRDYFENILKSTAHPDFTHERQILANIFRQDIVKLQDLIGRDLEHWAVLDGTVAENSSSAKLRW